MYPGSTLASYKSLPKKCLVYVENFVYQHWNQKNHPPPEQKIIQHFMSFQFRCHFLWCFFPPRSFGVKLLERNGDPKKERFGDPNWTSLGSSAPRLVQGHQPQGCDVHRGIELTRNSSPDQLDLWIFRQTNHFLLLMAEILHHLGCIKPCK